MHKLVDYNPSFYFENNVIVNRSKYEIMQLATATHNKPGNRYGKPILCTKLILIFDRDLLIPSFISLTACFCTLI